MRRTKPFSHPWLDWLYCSAILAEVEKIYQEGQVLVIGTRYSFGVEKTNMFICFRCFLENHTLVVQNLYPFSEQNHGSRKGKRICEQ